jgi:hypothetical protein
LPVLVLSIQTPSSSGPTSSGASVQAAATTNATSGESGIAGQVNIRPIRPHATIGAPNLAPYQARLEVLDTSGHSVASLETDPGGSFRIALPPGTYVLRPQSSGPYPRASEQRIVVPPKGFSQVTVVFDSGIR